MTTEEGAPAARTRGGDPNVTWADTAKYIGTDYSGGIILVADERIDKTFLARYCAVFEFGNLTYWDEEIARRAGYRSQVAPWAAVKDTCAYGGSWRPGEPTRYPLNLGIDASARQASRSPSAGGPPVPVTDSGFFTDMTIEFFEPVCLGDNLTIMGHRLHHVTPRETRVGVGAFVGYTSSYFNQFGQKVAEATQGSYSFVRKEDTSTIQR